MHLPAAPGDTQIQDVIDAWIADLARGDYAGAHARTAQMLTTAGRRRCCAP